MHLRKFYFLTLFLKLYLFFSIPPCHILSMQNPLEFLPKIWSFGHFAVFYAWLLLVLSLIWWIENRSFDEKKNRAGGNEDCGFCLLCFIYYLLFIIYYLLFIIYYLLFIYCLFPYPLSPDCFLKRDGELVRTACAFRATLNALETGNHVFCLLAFDQWADALQVAVAAAGKSNVADGVVVVKLYVYQAAACALGGVGEMFHNVVCIKKWVQRKKARHDMNACQRKRTSACVMIWRAFRLIDVVLLPVCERGEPYSASSSGFMLV